MFNGIKEHVFLGNAMAVIDMAKEETAVLTYSSWNIPIYCNAGSYVTTRPVPYHGHARGVVQQSV